MPIFQIKGGAVARVAFTPDSFASEAKLRDFFAENLEELLGVRFLAKEYQTDAGFIDTLAIDEADTPVIIEYKWDQDRGIVPQGLFYLNWLLKNRNHFALLVASKLGKGAKVNWDRPRVILVSREFDQRTLAAAQVIDNVELVKYAPYQGGILHLETVQGAPQKAKNKPLAPRIPDAPVYDLEYHLSASTPEVRQIFLKLRERVTALPGVHERLDQKSGITYRTTKSFTRFEFSKTYIDILVRDPKYNDPRALVRDVTKNEWGYKGQMKIKEVPEVAAVFDVIRQSYESTL
jgi:predicted transport protein